MSLDFNKKILISSNDDGFGVISKTKIIMLISLVENKLKYAMNYLR